MRAVIVCILVFVTFWQASQLTPVSNIWDPALLLATATVVEYWSLRVQGWTVLSAGFILYLAAPNVLAFTSAQVYFLILTCLIGRTLVRWNPSFEANAKPFVQDLLPLGLAMTVHQLVQSELSLGSYAPGFLAAFTFLPAYLLFLRSPSSESTLEVRRKLIFAQIQPLLLLLVVLAALSYGVPFPFYVALSLASQFVLRRTVAGAEAQHSAILEHRLKKTEAVVIDTETRYRSLRKEFQFRDKENQLLQSVGQEMVQARNLEEAVLSLLGIVEKLLRVHDSAFYSATRKQLLRGTRSGGLIRENSRLIAEASRSKEPKAGSDKTAEGLEIRSVAISLGSQGILLLARREQPFSTRDAELLRVLAEQAREALASAHHHEKEQQKSTNLDFFLEASLQMAKHMEMEQLQKTALGWARRIVGSEKIGLEVEPEWHFRPEPGVSLSREEEQWLSLFSLLVRQVLANQDLLRELAEKSKDAALKQIAACLAHELNTPFGAVRLQLEMVESKIGRDPVKAKRSLSKANTSLKKAERILAGLLHFTTPYGVEPVMVELPTFIEEILERENWSERVKLRIEGQTSAIPGYPKELEQLVKQLTQNALDATDSALDGHVAIKIRNLQDGVSLLWEDNGPGISEEVGRRIFEPFFTTKDVGEGLGLGLTLAREVATRHQGDLTLVDTEGGATFELRLPSHWLERAT